MARPEIVALVATSYAATMFAVHRARVWWHRAHGPDIALLRRLDSRVLLADLEPVYRAGLPPEPAVPVAWPANPLAPTPLAAESPWESPSLATLRTVRDALFAGEPVEAVPSPGLVSLTVHAWGRWLALGDPLRAKAVARSIGDAAPAVAAKLAAVASIAIAATATADGARSDAYAEALRAVRGLRLAGSRKSDADLSSRYLDAYLRLAFLTNGWNLEWSVSAAGRFLRRSIRDLGHAPCLYLALALGAALAGRSEEAVDELGRALYYARGDEFYSRLVLDDDFVSRVRPALVAQCRSAAKKDV